MNDEPVIERHLPSTLDLARGLHYPEPIKVDGKWKCQRCGRRLSRYIARGETRRLRHNWRDR